MILPHTVQLAFKLFLGRWPKDQTELEVFSQLGDLDHLRQALATSPDYRRVAGHWSDHVPSSLPVEDEYVVVFQHIPKCGGSSFELLLREDANEHGWKMCSERHNGLLNWPLSHLLECTLFCGHYDTASLKFLPRKQKIVTLLRDPKARLVSMYQFLRGHTDQLQRRFLPANMGLASLANQLSLAEFFAHPYVLRHPSIYNGMVSQLSGALPYKRWEALSTEPIDVPLHVETEPENALSKALAHLRSMAAYGFVEDMDRSINFIMSSLGLTYEGDVPHVNASFSAEGVNDNPSLMTVLKEEMSDATIAALEALTELDRQLYDIARAEWSAPDLPTETQTKPRRRTTKPSLETKPDQKSSDGTTRKTTSDPSSKRNASKRASSNRKTSAKAPSSRGQKPIA